MFTDMAGYTALGQENEHASLELLEGHRQLLRPLFSKHAGREIKTMGDAFLVEFHSALEATLCAIDIQSTVHSRNLERGEKLQVRVGIHVGDVVHQGNDVLGDAVNIASRIEPLAMPGGICLSEQVHDQIRNKVPYQLIKIQAGPLKNVRERFDVYKVVLPWDRSDAGAETSPRLDRRRVAVLPFVNISPDPADEYFADGMTEELISTMSRIRGLSVIARASVMGYKGGQKKISDVAKELEVGTVLEGSIRKAGNRLRITVQLIDSQTSDHRWAESYDRELRDVFAVQSEISKTVAEALEVQFMTEDR
jgi:adenylate cyclase